MTFPKGLIQLAAPQHAYLFSTKLFRWLIFPTLFLLILGLYWGLYLAPADYQQGEGYRIIYVHVPCAFLSLGIYSCMALSAVFAFIWRIKLYDYLIAACAPIGALATALALITGALWGKPMWGTYWVWDARLTSELIQLFLYLGIIGLKNALSEHEQGNALVRILVIAGFINLPIIHFSVYWWNTLHQADTLRFFGPSLIAPAMLYPLLIMICAMGLLASELILLRFRLELLHREFGRSWIKEVLQQ